MVSEQRRYTRLPLDGSVGIKIQNGHMVLTQGLLNDFGLGGFRVLAREEIDKEERVDFILKTPSLGHSLRGKGKVKNIQKITRMGAPYYSMGVEFTDVDKTKVRRMMEKKMRGWDKRRMLVQESKNDLFIALKLAPVLFLIAWITFQSFRQLDASNRKERSYSEDFRRGVIYSLFNGK